MADDGLAARSTHHCDLRTASLSLYEEVATLSLEPSRSLSIVEQWASTSTPSASQADLLDALSHLVLHPLCTVAVAVRFYPLLTDILVRAVERVETAELGWSDASNRDVYHTLAALLPPFPTILPLVRLFLAIPSLVSAPLVKDRGELDAFLLSTYRLVNDSPSIFQVSDSTWSSKAFLAVVHTEVGPSQPAKLLALRIFASLEGVSDSTHQEMQVRFGGHPSGESSDGSMATQGDYKTEGVEQFDGWTVPLQEARRVLSIRRAAKKHCSGLAETRLHLSLLTDRTVSIGGHLFHRSVPTLSPPLNYKETPRLQPILSDLGCKLSAQLPILLSGPEACGKTSLIRYACSLLYPSEHSNPIITLQLGDQSGVDAKSLVGSFVSSTKTPGTFEWAEGALTRAVRMGKWVVLEDVDRASGEVLSVVKPLVEDMCASKATGSTATLDLGSRGRVHAGLSFALFSTRTTTMLREGSSMPKPTFFGHEHWEEVQMNALGEDDVLEIVKSSNPLLATAQDGTPERLVSTWSKLVSTTSKRSGSSSLSKDRQSTGSVRPASFHDLLKWCRRVEASLEKSGPAAAKLAKAPLSNQALQEEMAIEACDIFLGSTPPSAASVPPDPTDRYATMVELLSEQLQVDGMAVWHNVAERRPECKVESDGEGGKRIVIGRGVVQRSEEDSSTIQPISRNFAMTGPAARLMEKIAVCVSLREAALIVGETGTGKTTVVQHLASLARKPLIALNLSQQTETSDLLGGFKPLDAKMPAMELHNEWVNLFQQTFSSRRNARFMQAERKAMQGEKWSRLYSTWKESVRLALDKVGGDMRGQANDSDEEDRGAQKARKLTNGGGKQTQSTTYPNGGDAKLQSHQWLAFRDRIESFAVQYTGKKRHLVFAFVEGPLVKAIRTGAWVLLDEINLATSETLDCLTALLQSPDSSIVLTERGDLEPIPRHPDFRLFACMNPATDVGKKDLPSSLRTRFTELYAPSPDDDQEALVSIVEKYIGQESVGDRGLILDVAQCYAQIRKLSRAHQLADGANQRPHYSIRTLSRALTFAKDVCPTYGLRRAVWEGFIMTFTMLLDERSAGVVRDLISKDILSKARNAQSTASFVPPRPKGNEAGVSHVQLGSFWLEAGPLPLDPAEDYILTPSVQDKLVGLARAALTRRSPVLIQGPTSAGKTSAVEYLARRTGHRFVRINNHEHTDIQEYIGSYASDPDSGQLVFHEGLLVTALRRGHWIVLDELNLAPTDVLEALNRLLDDNRELIIPETGEAVKPHAHFMLFATQNPPGLYAGRKVLSRAFRNRFLETHFQDVPQAELQTILTKRCQIAPSYAEKVVQVFRELQRRRQTGRVFDANHAFVTLRDLFRWGNREAGDYQQLAENGYMLIGERARRSEDRLVVKSVIEDVIKVKINTATLYDVFDPARLTERLGPHLAPALLASVASTTIVWTASMQRLVCLIASSLRYREPVLLVGETGSGKTSVCEVLAKVFGRSLVTVNCHQSTDTADLIGGQRPLRNRSVVRESARQAGMEVLKRVGASVSDEWDSETVAAQLLQLHGLEPQERQEVETAVSKINQSLGLFEWSDGPLVQTMKQGNHLLLDEISLADDSVLERLNSVLEPGRTLVLAERSTSDASQSVEIKADESFQVVATMNPGGDYGKKELSPALRNRFTEIWVPAVQERRDLLQIVNSQWAGELGNGAEMEVWAAHMVDFLPFFTTTVGGGELNAVGLRDLIAWARFINAVVAELSMPVDEAFVNGAFMTFIDGAALNPWVATKPKHQIQAIIATLSKHIFDVAQLDQPAQKTVEEGARADSTGHLFRIGHFSYPKGDQTVLESSSSSFNLAAKTPCMNAVRVMRAMQIRERAIMLEGSPGAGKTSLVVALAKACNYKLTRINLSDQTELSDLFGADLPVEGGKAGEFDWRDAAFLQAMQQGGWVLLDEMNLASQSVLEGLNSCLDHRGSVYVPDLGRTFTKHPDFRIFAAQNPQHQGGGRKGLPKSFLNRFTKVYVEELHDGDFADIITTLYPHFDQSALARMIHFNGQLQLLLQESTLFSKQGQPWEFNLRDLLRWLDLIHASLGLNLDQSHPIEYFGSLYLLRFRSRLDRIKVARLFHGIFGVEPSIDHRPWLSVSSHLVQLGHVVLPRHQQRPLDQRKVNVPVSRTHLGALQALGECVRLAWPAILVGESRSGKTALVRKLAEMTNCELEEVRMNSGTDATDVIGSFQQVDDRQEAGQVLKTLQSVVQSVYTSSRLHLSGHAGEQDLISSAKTLFSEQGALIDGSHSAPLAWQTIIDSAGRLEQSSLLNGEERSACSHALQRLHHFSQQDWSQASGKFAWIDGAVLRAVRKGCWLLLDDANLSSSSVLDRLNSLLEPGGNLVLSERGIVESGEIEVITPHPHFRIFFALNPRYGELSRAMRNRGLEVYLDGYEEEEEGQGRRVTVDDASLQNVLTWSEPIESECGEPSYRATVALALLGQALSPFDLALARHVLPLQHMHHLQPLLDNAHLTTASRELKDDLAQTTKADGAFLHQMGLDLQLNPATWRPDGQRMLFHHQLQLLVKTSALVSRLQGAAQTGEGDWSVSILGKSARYSGGEDVEQLSHHDRHLYPLVTGVAVGLLDRLGKNLAGLPQGVIEDLSLLLDCAAYLTAKWSDAELNDYSVTKIIVAKMQTALHHLSFLGMASLDEVEDEIDLVSRQVTLTSGHAIHHLWAAFLPLSDDEDAADLAVSISQRLAAISTLPRPELISNAVDVAATLSRPDKGWSEGDHNELLAVARRVIAALDFSQPSAEEEEDKGTGSEALLLSTLLLTVCFGRKENSEGGSSGKEALVELIKTSETFPKDAAIDPVLQINQSQPLSESRLGWVKSLFKSEAGNSQDLFRPLLFQAVLTGCSSTKVPFAELEEKRDRLKRLARLVCNVSPVEGPSRGELVAKMLKQSISATSSVLFRALRDQYQPQEEEEKEELLNLYASCEAGSERLHTLERLMALPLLSPECKAIGSDLKACVEQEVMVERAHGQSDALAQLGLAAIRSGMTLLSAYLPNIAIDPLVAQRTEGELQLYQAGRLQDERAALLDVEDRVTGNKRNNLTDAIDARLAALSARENQQGSVGGVVRRGTDTDLLHKLHREMLSFSQQVLAVAKVEEVLQSGDGVKVRGRLLNLQSTICALMDRLPRIYGSLWDLTKPVEHALAVLLLGLGLLLQANTLTSRGTSAARNESILDGLVAFPTTLATRRYLQEEIPIRLKANSLLGTLAVPLLLMKVRAVVFEMKFGGMTVARVKQLKSAYDQLWHLWTLDEEHERQEREEEQSLYKVKKLDMSVEEEAKMEEDEFLSLFPEYADIMEESNRTHEARGENGKQTGKQGRSFATGHVLELFTLHLVVFEKDLAREEDSFEMARVDVAQKLMQANYADLSEHLDAQSGSLQASLLGQALAQDQQESGERDFYTESNRSEAIKLFTVVENAMQRLDELIRDWPEQEVLQHIKQRCQAIMLLDSSSPIHRLLSSLEGLLVHTEDWQMYASSRNTLQPQRDQITALIIEWRRLELRGWKGLLNKESIRSRKSVCEMWFTLFQMLSKAGFDEESSTNDLVSLLDQYLRSSTLGQYSTRLQLIHSFAGYLRSLCQHLDHQHLRKVQLILQNIHHFFSQFEITISDRLAAKRRLIEGEIGDYVKLASWKDTNVHALKVSAAKTHRKLHRCLRKFRDALNEGVDPILASFNDGKEGKQVWSVDKGMPLTLPNVVMADGLDSQQPWHLLDATPAHLVKLTVTLGSLERLYSKDIESTLDARESSLALVDLSTTIITRSEELAKQTPAIWKAENEKLVKNLETRKRKAWSDLLRELRRIGWTVTSIEGVSVLDLSRASFIYTVTMMDGGHLWTDVQEADRIHYRLLSLLPVLRSTIGSNRRNQDVHVSQLQKGLAFVEAGFLASVVERQKLGMLFAQLDWVAKVQTRVVKLGEKGDLTRLLGDPFVAEEGSARLASCLDAWTRLQSALEEIQRNAGSHLTLFPFESRGAEGVLAEVGQCQGAASAFTDKLRKLIDSIHLSRSSLVSGEEREEMREGAALVDRVEASLEHAIDSVPSLRSMCIPTLDWLRLDRLNFALDGVLAKEDSAGDPDAVGRQSDRVISSVLVIAQQLCRLKPAMDREEDEGGELADHGVVLERQRLASVRSTLRIAELQAEVEHLFYLGEREVNQAGLVQAALARLAPFLGMYRVFMEEFVLGCARWYRALMKLDVTVCKLVLSLASNGFCKPREEEEQGGEAGTENDEKLEGGMGLGEGEGAEDVTETLKDDEMMEELETEEKEKDKEEGETKGEKNAREMDDDFDGEMGDVEKDEEGEEEGDEGEEEEEKEVEEGVGEVDPLDLDAVDEKTWAGQDEEQKGEEKDKSEKEREGEKSKERGSEEGGKTQEEGENEAGAEEAGEREQGQEAKKGEEEQGNEGDEKEDQEGGEEEKEGKADGEETKECQEGEEGEEGEEDHQDDQGLGRAIDQEAEQGENLDLDEDLHMDGEEKSEAGEDSEMDGLSAMGDEEGQERESAELEADEQQETTKAGEEEQAEQEEGGEEEGEEDVEVPHGAGEEAREDDKEGEEENQDEDAGQADKQDQGAQESGPVDDMRLDDSGMGGDAAQDTPTNQQHSSKSSSGRQADANDTSSAPEGGVRQEKDASASQTQPKEEQGEEGKGEQQEQGQEGQGREEEEREEKEEGRPSRSLGDALREFKRNMEAIEESMGEEAKRDGEGMPEEDGGEVEHIRDDEDSQMQALGAAMDDEALHSLDEVGQEADQGEEESRAQVDEEVEQLKAKEELQPISADEEAEQGEGKRDSGGGLMTSDVQPKEADDGEVEMAEEEEQEEEDGEEEGEEEAAIEAQMDALFASSDEQQRQEIAQDLWKSYLGATADYAFTLSEQLRLILAPTKATKLTGDFKTGKRLNMRKIIPFIASDYLKDKIWLRRNLAQKREYQVLLSIDDSKSMLESKNMHLAFKSLALVCSALDKLEVGQIGVMKFGKETELVKGFVGAGTETIQDQEGGKILERLQFQQRGTDVSAMLQTSYKVLMEARESQSVSSSQLWQLQIIISDGICQDHSSLQALLRRASEERIMVVFVILDSLQQQNNGSILTMNSVQYTTGANGRPQLQMKRYLDTFPFEYFVVVRDVADLPDVLSTTLRQWAQKIAES